MDSDEQIADQMQEQAEMEALEGGLGEGQLDENQANQESKASLA